MDRAKDAVAAISGSGDNSSDRAREVWQLTWRFSLLSGLDAAEDQSGWSQVESQRSSHTRRRKVKAILRRRHRCTRDCDDRLGSFEPVTTRASRSSPPGLRVAVGAAGVDGRHHGGEDRLQGGRGVESVCTVQDGDLKHHASAHADHWLCANVHVRTLLLLHRATRANRRSTWERGSARGLGGSVCQIV